MKAAGTLRADVEVEDFALRARPDRS